MQTSLLQTKKHFFALDGLRGIAAICVVIFHFSEFIYPSDSLSPIGHGYLAVDFFFCLSGFVIGYAYDDRIQKLGIKQFFISRLIRLHPLVVIGSIFGFLFFIFEPSKAVDSYGVGKLIFLLLCTTFLIPYSGMDNRYNNNFGLNCPAWSLFWEYIANIAYAIILKRINKKWLTLVVFVAALGLLWTGYHAGDIAGGWSGNNFWDGFARIGFSFSMGLLLYRLRWKSKKQIGFILLTILLMATFFAPFISKWNWLIECLIAILIYPALIILGTNVAQNNIAQKVCKFLGDISYPLYMTHYSLVWYFGYYHEKNKWSISQSWCITAVGVVLVILFAYAVEILLDAPIRKYFSNKRKEKLASYKTSENRSL
ncbi:acyltransferase family protein [Arachidicoccus sp.]|uniref:acyltransferase family protein n=1 Tax=Arachidicoccus sp. TaxID=1872624 RepID=UPI003D258647